MAIYRLYADSKETEIVSSTIDKLLGKIPDAYLTDFHCLIKNYEANGDEVKWWEIVLSPHRTSFTIEPLVLANATQH